MAEERSLKAMAGPLTAWAVLAAASIAALYFAIRHAPPAPFWPDEWMQTPVAAGQRPFSLGWLLSFHNEHRIPLPKLLWVGVMRMTNFDSRWGAALNVALLTAAASVVLLAVRRFRGRTLWTDAFLALLFLHWGHWENLTWPFQVCWALQTLLAAILIRATLRPEPIAFNVALPLLPLCGAATLPFVGLMATWRIFRLWKEAPRRLLPMVLPLAALLIIPAYFIGVRKPPQYPPNPGPMSTLKAALQCLAGSLGPVDWWPAIGILAFGLLVLAVVLLVRGARRDPALRPPAEGLLLMLGALVALALLIGQSRAGVSPVVGFTSRYALLFSIFPLIAYVAAEFCAAPAAARAIRTGLFAILAIATVVNGLHAATHLEMRDVAGVHLLRDVRAGMSPRLVVHRNPFWSPDFEPEMQDGMQALVDSRRWMYRTLPPPVAGQSDAGGNLFTELRDGRLAVELRRDARVLVPLQAGPGNLRLDIGHLLSSTGRIRVQCTLLRGGSIREPLFSETLRRAPGIESRVEQRVALFPGSQLEIVLEADGPRDSPPRDVELAVIVTFVPARPGP